MKIAVWLGGKNSYEDAAEYLRRLSGISISKSTLWRHTNKWAEALENWQAKEIAQANQMPSSDEPEPGEERHSTRMGVGLDGWMVNIRDEGWKEVKSGVIYEVEQGQGRDELTGETTEIAQAVNGTYFAHLGGPEAFGEKLWDEARRRKLPGAYEKAAVCDAAAWIWNLILDYVPKAEQIVDWYHAVEHLYQAAHALYGEKKQAAKRWCNEMKLSLYQGHAARIADILDKRAQELDGDRAATVRSEATFFRNHQRRMQYMDYREGRWPIGSGTIESTCKQFQGRLKGPGMRWSRPGATRMLSLCASILSDRFDMHWAILANSPKI